MIRVRRTLGVALALGALTACAGGETGAPAGETAAAAAAPAASDPAAVRAAIDAANKQAIESINAGKLDGWLASYYAEDAVVMMSGMKAMVGRAAIEAGMKGMFEAADLKNFQVTTNEVIVEGDLAIESGSNTLEMGPKGGKLVADTLKFLTVWKKQADGSWKVIRDINNSDIAPKM